MYSGDEVTAVQSSCSFTCCSGMQTEETRCGEQSLKRALLWNQEVEDDIQTKNVTYKAWFHNKFKSSLSSRNVEESSQPSRWKSPKRNLGRFSDIKWIPITGKQQIAVANHPQESIWRDYFKDFSNAITTTPPDTRKYDLGKRPSLQPNPPWCQKTWYSRLWWNPTWNAKSLESKNELFGLLVCVK